MIMMVGYINNTTIYSLPLSEFYKILLVTVAIIVIVIVNVRIKACSCTSREITVNIIK